MKFDATQRKGLSSAVYSLSNIVAASLIIGQFVSAAGPPRMGNLIVGAVVVVGGYVIATWLNREDPR